MDFKEFKEKYYGKSVEEIEEGLKNEKNFWKNEKSIIEVCLDIDKLISKIVTLDKDIPSTYILQKKIIMLKYILNTFTNLQQLPDVDTFEDFDINTEIAIYNISEYAIFVKEMVDESLSELRNIILEELYQIFNTKLPSSEEISKLQNDLGNIFKDESPEKLEMIENILSFNDSALKKIKEDLYSNKSKKQ